MELNNISSTFSPYSINAKLKSITIIRDLSNPPMYAHTYYINHV
jgi:hypothetical protein